MDLELARTIGERIANSTGGAWSLDQIDLQGGGMLLRLHSAEGAFSLEVRRAEPDRRAYRTHGDLAYSYRAGTVAPSPPILDRAIEALHRILYDAPPSTFEPAATPETVALTTVARPPSTEADFPTPFHRDHLERTLAIPDHFRAAFRRDGHVVLRGAFDRGVLLAARQVIVEALKVACAKHYVPVDERVDAYSRSFTQVTNLGLDDAVIRAFTQARRLAKMAADLMGVRSVRIFCEDWLIKDPGLSITPWHQDAAVMPFDTDATITLWIPFQPVREGTGVLRFARGSHQFGVQKIETINDDSEEAFAEIIRSHDWAVDVNPPMLVGDVSAHHGATIHGAFPNDSDEPRIALALHCFADGAVLKEPTTPTMGTMREIYAPGLATGARAATRFWPLVYDAEDASLGVAQVSAAMPALHLRATLLPGGSAPTDVWVQDGRLRFAPITGARDLAPAGGFLTSGLVDCHAHLSWPHTPEMEAEAQSRAFMDTTRALYANGGVLALRDMGSASDHVAALLDRPGLPRVHAAGRLIVPYTGFPFTPVAPDALVAAFLERLDHGASWIKVFTDWSNDWGGQQHTGFGERNAVTYPLEVLTAAVEAAHARGGRVAAHCFTPAGAAVAIAAGVDSLEHGWGVDGQLLEEMAERGIAWVPLVGIASTMWRQEPAQVEWVERNMAALAELVPHAHSLGVRILAGTDWFPEVGVAEEIRELHALGLPAAVAAAAGMWEARRWLGEPGLEEGAPADLVLFAADPRHDLDRLDAPTLILVGGEPAPAAPPRQRSRTPWADRHSPL